MRLSRRDRRALLSGTVTVAVVVTYTGVIKPIRRVSLDLERRRDIASEFLARYRGLIAASEAYAAAADTANARLSRLLPETFVGSPQGSVNQLLEMLDRAAAANDVRIMRASPVPVDSVGSGVLRIGAALECESDLWGVLGFLRSLETAGKLFHIAGLRVAAAGGSVRGDDIEALRFGFTVRAFVLVPLDEAEDAEATAR
ncbi:MAG: hypothetical protein AMS25_11460 [Gemmatimonas sp. SM23_52]|nr:MAG: hypothetical protein AMS25_11460 [Gemmatimonas sp. SM23_52]